MSGVIGNGAGGSASGLVKNGPGLLILTGVNTYGDGQGYDAGATQINQGALQADWGVGYSSNSGLILNGGVLQSNSAVTFTNRMWYDGWNDSVTWYSGGFSAGGGKMTVNLYGDGRTISFRNRPPRQHRGHHDLVLEFRPIRNRVPERPQSHRRGAHDRS